MFGPKVKYCVTYKANQRSFDIYRRKYEHDFKVSVVTKQNLEGALGLEMESINSIIVAKIDDIRVYDSEFFKENKDINIQVDLLKADTREPN